MAVQPSIRTTTPEVTPSGATRAEHWRAIKERTTRGMFTYNTHRVHHLEGSLWAVPSTCGGYYTVDLELEVCNCEDFTYFGAENDVACRHIVAAAITHQKRQQARALVLRHLEERLAHDLLEDEERQEELRDRVIGLRRRLSR